MNCLLCWESAGVYWSVLEWCGSSISFPCNPNIYLAISIHIKPNIIVFYVFVHKKNQQNIKGKVPVISFLQDIRGFPTPWLKYKDWNLASPSDTN